MDAWIIVLIGYLILCGIVLYQLYLLKLKSDRNAFINNSIELMVMVNKHYTDSEKLRLLVAMINDINFLSISDCEKKIFLEIVKKHIK